MEEKELKVEALKVRKELLFTLLKLLLGLITLLLSGLTGILYKEGSKVTGWLLLGVSLLVILGLVVSMVINEIHQVAKELKEQDADNPFLNELPLGDKLQFLNDPVISFSLSVAVDLIMSFDKCNSCSSESCATAHGEYKAYSLISNGLCHYVGSKCAWKIPLIGCLRRAYRYCCYDSKFARILVEQAYKQLGYSWGSYGSPNCSQLTWDDLKNLDFSQMDFSELIKDIEAKANFHQLMDSDSIKNRIEEFYEGTTPLAPDATNPNYSP